MQKDYPKVKGVYEQINEPNYISFTYENIVRALHRVFYGTEMPEEEVQEMVRKHNERSILTDKD